MSSPKIQLLPQGFATRDAQSAEISKVSKMKRDRNAKITQKCGIIEKTIRVRNNAKSEESEKFIRIHLNGLVIPRVAWES